MSDRLLRDLVMRSPVERRRTGDAVVLFYLSAKAVAKAGGGGLDAQWLAVQAVTGDDATHAAIALGAFGAGDHATVQLVGACLRRLRNTPGGGRVPYPAPLVVAVNTSGVHLAASAQAGRGGYGGYLIRRVYRTPVVRDEAARRKRDSSDVQPFMTFKVAAGERENTPGWLEAVAHPATNAAFTGARLAAKSPKRRRLFEPWHQAMLRVVCGPGRNVDYRVAAQGLALLLLTRDPDEYQTMADRMDALRNASDNVDDPLLEPEVRAAASQAVRRLDLSVDDWRRRASRAVVAYDEPPDDDLPPPF